MVSIGVVCSSAVAASVAEAQERSPLQVGAHVSVDMRDSTCRRLWRSCPGAGVGGTLERATPDSLVLRLSPTTVVALPRRGAEVYVRTAGSRTISALRWSLTGGLGIAALLMQTDASRGSIVQTSLAATASGLAVGALRPEARWKKVEP